MLYLIVGIVLGAAFHEFWHDLFFKARNKVSGWMADKTKSGEPEVGSATTSAHEPSKEQPQN